MTMASCVSSPYKPHSRKGQAAVTDLFIAVAIFIVLVTITTLIWNLYNVRLESRLDYDTMVIKAYHLVDTIVRSPGYPETWEQVNNATEEPPSMIGLASYDHVLLQEKVQEFQDMDYLLAKQIMHIGLYEFYMIIVDPLDPAGTPIAVAGQPPQGKFTVNLARPVVYAGQPLILEFALWRE